MNRLTLSYPLAVQRMQMQAAYIGAKTDAYRRLLATDADSPMLQALFADAVACACSYAPKMRVEITREAADSAMPQPRSPEWRLLSGVACHMCAAWLQICSAPSHQWMKETAERHFSSLRVHFLLHFRLFRP